MTSKSSQAAKGLRQFLDLDQQQAWLEGAQLADADERPDSIEQRLRYAPRFQKLLRRPQAPALFEILERYGRTCIPIPRATERYYWSVSCLPSTSDKPLVRVNASWMELFTLYADGDDLRARFILHVSDFTVDGSIMPEAIDPMRLEQGVQRPEDLTYACPASSDLFIVKVRGAASIRIFLADPVTLRAIRRFNLTHMNRGRNAYQASHAFSVADYMLGEGEP
ncbi:MULTISPECIES: hypothetical protein [unclassified Sphingopyxis]|uniref:hypothetical protein n=1 Tax=unclassified Sphingopyxis TaxID=2614943 RepID=UPI000736F955|nr:MULTISPECIES: hypothetical protein [unclassified Sphingopyxis]KTE40058.1 hypothetical protein ATE62_08125 [Sphingopyxis sp. HIX]KTE86000.1 hypothetical protein ATE72_00090 [Sphingopyxis sp. HXXIV]